MNWRLYSRIEWILYDEIKVKAWNEDRWVVNYEGLRAWINGPRTGYSLKEWRDWLFKTRQDVYRVGRRIELMEARMADEKPREFRVVVQMQVIEHTGSYSSVDSQPVWTQRLMVIPVERIKAFNLQEVAEAMVAETVDMTAK